MVLSVPSSIGDPKTRHSAPDGGFSSHEQRTITSLILLDVTLLTHVQIVFHLESRPCSTKLCSSQSTPSLSYYVGLFYPRSKFLHLQLLHFVLAHFFQPVSVPLNSSYAPQTMYHSSSLYLQTCQV